jgi:hypothetical protein
MMRWFLGCALAIFAATAQAGYMELGVNGNYRKAYLDQVNSSEAQAMTGSFAYYFGAMSALEANYTYGSAKTILKFNDRPEQTTQVDYEMAGLDLVVTLAGQDAPIRPYVKGGAAYIIRKDTSFRTGGTEIVVGGQPGTDTGLVPSAGAGLRIGIAKAIAIKLGVEGWASTPRNTGLWDVMYRAGVSVMF